MLRICHVSCFWKARLSAISRLVSLCLFTEPSDVVCKVFCFCEETLQDNRREGLGNKLIPGGLTSSVIEARCDMSNIAKDHSAGKL